MALTLRTCQSSLIRCQFRPCRAAQGHSSPVQGQSHSRPLSSSLLCQAQQGPEFFPTSASKEEWLRIDEKVNKYPSQRTFKAIGNAGTDSEEFVSQIVNAVEEAGDQAILKKQQVSQRPSKNGKYLSVSVSKINVESGEQVYGIYEAIRTQCGDRLKFIL